MTFYIQLIIDNVLDRICLYIGIIDLKFKVFNDVVNFIVDFVRIIQFIFGVKVVLFELIMYKDVYKELVKFVNKFFIKYFKQYFWFLVCYFNIIEKVLNRGGLYLINKVMKYCIKILYQVYQLTKLIII